jgi:DNA-binding response OmpR family regulator
MIIFLVEDEPDLGAAIKRALNQEAYVSRWTQLKLAVEIREQGTGNREQ